MTGEGLEELGEDEQEELSEEPQKIVLGKRSKPAEEQEEDSVYYVKEGLRFVKPYTHDFETHAKRRWLK